MQVEEIKEKIQLAKQLVKDLEDPYKTEAFGVILSKLLESELLPTTKKLTKTEKPKEKKMETIEERIRAFAEKANISTERLEDVFDFEEDKPTFLANIEGTDAGKQVRISQCVISVYDEMYLKPWTPSSILYQILKDKGVGSLQHLSENLSRRRGTFRKKGKGKATRWKLTNDGKRETLDLIRELAS